MPSGQARPGVQGVQVALGAGRVLSLQPCGCDLLGQAPGLARPQGQSPQTRSHTPSPQGDSGAQAEAPPPRVCFPLCFHQQRLEEAS